ncbi:MAG TPA: lipoate protein ligase C-terminal domain-containing protein [Spirochaetota bacterium]|nr:lipoate protein ligase C-terminal domain-containing protein [Spirochaetota bacterium]HNT12944.1 lipoate protein ligase C-terminal domain-containing protein [Spirochaetota bacterium]HNV46997.1 lipoate protein ligase C-terminal domain-containing protein [Spirochaetota bacterium]HOS40177.1 lipoate protein ligase C-terminal domain-containing protein [Spirochaetota bacterium]HPI22892.1 lipoate protein ligase C-terminal domain-containing protein [Spirochaetota bacterium]
MTDGRLEASCKPTGGKLVRVSLSLAGGRIERIAITGDFFIMPESGVEDIEAALVGADPGAVRARIDAVVRNRGLRLAGVSPASIAEAVRRALEGGERPA